MSEVIIDSNSTPTVGVEEKFKAALSVIRSLPKNGSYKPSPEMMLKFYSYYKQATEGPCTKTKPWAWDLINKAKWDAWSKLGDMPKEDAMENYVQSLTTIVEAMPASDNVQSFIQLLGNFYQVVEIPLPEQFGKYSKITSTPLRHQAPTLNGNGMAHNGLNGHGPHSEMDESSASESAISADGLQDNSLVSTPLLKADGDVPLKNQGSQEKNQASQTWEEHEDEQRSSSDSEDEFCDTAEEIAMAKQNPSMTNSYTMVGSSGSVESGSSSKSDSLSTLDETFESENGRRNGTMADATETESQQTTTSTVKVRTRGGEYGARGADNKMTSSSQRGTSSRSGGQSRSEDGSHFTRQQEAGGGPGRGGERAPVYSYSEVQDQIATTLLQLQQDMNSVLNRLTILEALTVGQQARNGRTISDSSGSPGPSPRQQRHRDTVPSWWPFSDLSPKTALFVILWPFVARWIIHVVRRRRRLR